MNITDRDRALFDYLFSHKIATVEQINQCIFNLPDLCDVRKRLKILVQQDFLRRTTVEGPRPKYAFYLSESSFKKYISHRLGLPWRQLKSDAPEHDTLLVDLKQRFLLSPKVVGFLTENAIKADFERPTQFPILPFREAHCDGAISIKGRSKVFHVALEYENSEQANARYETKFMSYYATEEINAVIYVTKSRSLFRRLMDLEKGVIGESRPKIFYGPLADVLNPAKPMSFENIRGEHLRLFESSETA